MIEKLDLLMIYCQYLDSHDTKGLDRFMQEIPSALETAIYTIHKRFNEYSNFVPQLKRYREDLQEGRE